MGVVAVGKQMERTDQFFKLATRILVELGDNIIKTYYCDNIEEVVVAGGENFQKKEVLTLAYNSIKGGTKGLDMNKNIFQSEHAVDMSSAIRKIVHKGFTYKESFEFYEDAIHK